MYWGTNRYLLFFFFFQAEDGIRDSSVTGVQTCALPISPGRNETWRGERATLIAEKEREKRMELNFAGKKLIVIGGTSGIGKAVASLVLSNGGSAVLVGRRETKTRDAILELRPRGEVCGWTGDITSGAGRASLSDHLHAKHADATLLVNAAGGFAPKPFLEHTEPDYDRYLEINRALFFITQCVAKNMVSGKRGGSTLEIRSTSAR